MNGMLEQTKSPEWHSQDCQWHQSLTSKQERKTYAKVAKIRRNMPSNSKTNPYRMTGEDKQSTLNF